MLGTVDSSEDLDEVSAELWASGLEDILSNSEQHNPSRRRQPVRQEGHFQLGISPSHSK